jgi:hypothetical protein
MHYGLTRMCFWLQQSRLVSWLASSDYAYPFIQWSHFTGLSLWFATTLALDFRLLGTSQKIAISDLLDATFALNWVGLGIAVLGGFYALLDRGGEIYRKSRLSRQDRHSSAAGTCVAHHRSAKNARMGPNVGIAGRCQTRSLRRSVAMGICCHSWRVDSKLLAASNLGRPIPHRRTMSRLLLILPTLAPSPHVKGFFKNSLRPAKGHVWPMGDKRSCNRGSCVLWCPR